MENTSLMDELCREALDARISRIKVFTIEEVANEVRNALLGGMNKKEFAQWFEIMIAEHKSKYVQYPHPKW